MTVRGLELPVVTTTRSLGRSAQDRAARVLVRTALRWGALWTALLMVLPGLLSSRPVENGLTGVAVGASLTAAAALAAYVWRSYVVPYRRVRSLLADQH